MLGKFVNRVYKSCKSVYNPFIVSNTETFKYKSYLGLMKTIMETQRWTSRNGMPIQTMQISLLR